MLKQGTALGSHIVENAKISYSWGLILFTKSKNKGTAGFFSLNAEIRYLWGFIL